MKTRSDKGSKSASKTIVTDVASNPGKAGAKGKKVGKDTDAEEDAQSENIEAKDTKLANKGKAPVDELDGDEELEVADDWEKPESDDDDWDPDFDEFDIPKSGAKKVSGLKKTGKDEDDDFKVDDEFKDMFNDAGYDKDDEDDY